jgi:uncharacterized protein DUF1877
MSMIGSYRRVDESALQRLLDKPEGLSDFLFSEDDSDSRLDIDKTWHVIHFLLNGDPWDGIQPLVNVVLGGTQISTEDLGYGPARYLTISEVRDVAAALAPISSEELMSRFDAQAVMRAKIYPEGWTGDAEDREYIATYFDGLKEFFAEAAASKQAVVLYLS